MILIRASLWSLYIYRISQPSNNPWSSGQHALQHNITSQKKCVVESWYQIDRNMRQRASTSSSVSQLQVASCHTVLISRNFSYMSLRIWWSIPLGSATNLLVCYSSVLSHRALEPTFQGTVQVALPVFLRTTLSMFDVTMSGCLCERTATSYIATRILSSQGGIDSQSQYRCLCTGVEPLRSTLKSDTICLK